MDLPVLESKIQVLSLNFEEPQKSSLSGNSEFCYSLVNLSDEDKEKLQTERLKYVLHQLECERQDTTFSRDCLFCRKHFTGNRSLLLSHLVEQHNFMFGAPDNLVFVNELLDVLEQMLKELRCFYCEKIFKDWMTLKEHMRKKQHKRINPQNKNFDRFYLINYLELNKTWEEVQNEDDDGCSQEEDREMECEEESLSYVCLFCECKSHDFDLTLQHMKDEHKFDFKSLKEANGLNFYRQLKLVNYIRKKVYEKECLCCGMKFHFQSDLQRHLVEMGHTSHLPDPELWDQAIYYFSTFENDNFLCALDTEDAEPHECSVYPEDLPPTPMWDVTQEDI